MPKKVISGFKGLAEQIDPALLPTDYGVTCTNLNVDEPEGQLSIRKGYSNWKSTVFTNAVSVAEYRIEDDSGAIITMVNDNGTMKYYRNGTLQANPSLPAGSAVSSSHFNNYFGWRNSIRFTTGVGATNHILWFGYTDRDETASDGLFGNALGDSGTGLYRLLRSQIIPPNGIFSSDIKSVAYLDTFYYVSFINSKWIEKRDSNYQLVERWAVNEDERIDAADNGMVCLVANTSSSKLYVGTTGGIYQIDPFTHKMESEVTDAGAINITGICHDSTDIYCTAKAGTVFKQTIAAFTGKVTATASDSTGYSGQLQDISCNGATGESGTLYIIDAHATIRQRSKDDITADDFTYALSGVAAGVDTAMAIEYFDSDQVFVLCADTTGSPATIVNSYIVDLDASDVSTKNTQYADTSLFPVAFMFESGTTLRVIDGMLGMIRHKDATTLVTPELISLAIRPRKHGNITVDPVGSLAVGTYFYKVAVEDMDGQVYTLSDPLIVPMENADRQVDLRVVATGDRSETDKFTEFYRIKYVHIFRGYNENVDAEQTAGDYKFLKRIDINDPGWTNDSNYDLYYFEHSDNQIDSELTSVTYTEFSGISDLTKPRFVNGKYYTWLDSQLHLANVYSDGDSYPSMVVRAAVNSPDAMAFFDTYSYEEGYGQEIRGMSHFYNRTVVFKQFSTGIFKGSRLEDNLNVGIAYDRAYVKHHNTIYFAGDKGVYKLENNTPVLISDPVRTSYVTGVEGAFPVLYYIGELNRLIVGQLTTDTLIYNAKLNTWVKYSGWSGFRDFFKTSEGFYVAIDQTGLRKLWDGTDDGGTAITVTYKSGTINLDEFGVDNEITESQSKIALAKTGLGTDSLIFYVHKTGGTGQSTAKTVTLVNTTSSTYPIISTEFLSSLWGESFAFALTSEATQFLFSGLALKYNKLGDSAYAL